MDRATNQAKLKVWHWNANDLRCRKTILQQHIQPMDVPPGPHAPAKPVRRRGVCTFVRKGLTLIKLDRFLDCDTALELCAVEVVIGRKKQESVFVAEEVEFELLSDPQQPSRIGASITRDTTPDLVFAHLPDYRPVSWRNTGHNLSSDHYITEVEIPLKIRSKLPLTWKHKLTDWNAFRQHEIAPTIDDLEEWTRSLRNPPKSRPAPAQSRVLSRRGPGAHGNRKRHRKTPRGPAATTQPPPAAQRIATGRESAGRDSRQ
ncbi:hypothetical protein MRX96_027974 [Rhipicephalus microplus]